jgi:hypothetical protein
MSPIANTFGMAGQRQVVGDRDAVAAAERDTQQAGHRLAVTPTAQMIVPAEKTRPSRSTTPSGST